MSTGEKGDSMTRTFYGVLLILGVLYGTAWADSDLKSVLDGIRKNYGDLPGLTLNYDREVISKTMAMLGDEVKGDLASGQMFFKPPCFLKLVQSNPTSETITYDKETLWWHLPHEKRVYKYSAKEFGNELRLLSDIFRGLIRVDERFQTTLLDLNGREDHKIELRPLTPWQNMDRMILTVTKSYRIQKVSIHYQLGSITLFMLKDIQAKKDFEEGFFKFVVPEETILIQETSEQQSVNSNQ